jgi:hypothetical protein
MRPRIAPLLALLFFTAACAAVVADPWMPEEYDGLKIGVVALALSNASILWAYFGIEPTPAARKPHGRRRSA